MVESPNETLLPFGIPSKKDIKREIKFQLNHLKVEICNSGLTSFPLLSLCLYFRKCKNVCIIKIPLVSSLTYFLSRTQPVNRRLSAHKLTQTFKLHYGPADTLRLRTLFCARVCMFSDYISLKYSVTPPLPYIFFWGEGGLVVILKSQ